MSAPATAGARWRARVAAGAAALVLAAAPAGPAGAHVGTADAAYDGRAGAYPVRVFVRMPGVIPGQAQITVRLGPGAPAASRVLVQVAQWNVGRRGAPAPEAAAPVAGAPGTWSAPLWLMTRSSYLVNVTVEGAAGRGTTSVPVVAQSTARLAMPRAYGWGLAALGGVLVAGLLTMVGAAVREGVLPPGRAPDRARLRRARAATAAAGGVVALLLTGGKRWWDGVDRDYLRGMARPVVARARVLPAPAGGAPTLRLAVDDTLLFPRWTPGDYRGSTQTPLIPDHGKLVHLFALGEPEVGGGRVLAHLHPTPVDSAVFDAALPPLPAGRYRVYADVVHESGFARTLVAAAELPPPARPAAAPPGGAGEGDEAWYAGGAAPAGAAAPLGDGLTLTMESAAGVPARADTALRFTVRDAAGRPAEVEPYMGMAAHAVVARADGGVFVHLHPAGTISVAAQERLLRRERGDSAFHGARQPGDAHAGHAAEAVRYPGALAFPFAFPEPGAYRVWVQLRRGGRVRTAAFDVAAR